MAKKNQSKRLTNQHKESQGVVGIFGDEAKFHDKKVSKTSHRVIEQLKKDFSQLSFRYRTTIKKEEINEALKKIDPELGQTLFISNSSIIPDGGIIEVKDDNDNWRVLLVTEAKHQGKDIENIQKGNQVGKNNNQDLMAAGNAIERSHKNISEIANFMLQESHFPYILFLEGSCASRHLQCRLMFIKIIKVKKSKILANKRLGLQNQTSLVVQLTDASLGASRHLQCRLVFAKTYIHQKC